MARSLGRGPGAEAQPEADAGADERKDHDGRNPPVTTPLATPGLFDECLLVDHLGGWNIARRRRRSRAAIVALGLSVRIGPKVTNASLASTMLRVTVDRDEPTALHEQVAAEIRRVIAEGEAHPGERLPPARDLAAVLGVNANTVFRALRILRDEGLLEFRRGRGVTVAGTPERGAVLAQAHELLQFARQQGFRREELLHMIESLP